MDTAFTTFGIRASTDIDLQDTKATVRGMLGWRHAYGDITPNSNSPSMPAQASIPSAPRLPRMH